MEVYETEKSWLVSIYVLKEFKEDNGVHGFPSDPSHFAVLETDKMREVPNLMPTPKFMYRDPKVVVST